MTRIKADVKGKPSLGVTIHNGVRGKSAYQIWLEEGNEGTVQQFLDSLKANANLETFIFNQISAKEEWVINHRLNRYPSCTVVDTANSIVIGSVTYIDKNNLTISFNSEFSGKAFLN